MPPPDRLRRMERITQLPPIVWLLVALMLVEAVRNVGWWRRSGRSRRSMIRALREMFGGYPSGYPDDPDRVPMCLYPKAPDLLEAITGEDERLEDCADRYVQNVLLNVEANTFVFYVPLLIAAKPGRTAPIWMLALAVTVVFICIGASRRLSRQAPRAACDLLRRVRAEDREAWAWVCRRTKQFPDSFTSVAGLVRFVEGERWRPAVQRVKRHERMTFAVIGMAFIAVVAVLVVALTKIWTG